MIPSITVMASPEVGRIIDAFSDCFGLRIALFSGGGKELVVGRNKPCCPYCIYVRETLGHMHVCLAMDERKRLEALEEGGLHVYTCHAGMTEAVLPIFLGDVNAGGILAGFLMMGQFRAAKILSRRLLSALSRSETEQEKLKSLYRRTPFYDKVKRSSMYELFKAMVAYITSRNMLEIKQDYALGRITTLMHGKKGSRVTIPELAAHAGVSVSLACKLFKQTYGTTIKKTLIKMVMEDAGRRLLDYPDMPIKQAAYAAGFEDPYYFSRAFKRYFGAAPSDYRKKGGQR